MPYVARIEVLLDVNSETEACDAIAEAMRPLLLQFNDHADTALVDWRYAACAPQPYQHDGKGFEYAADLKPQT